MDKPFVTDGCSGGMSLLWRVVFRKPPPWEDLCVIHDVKYWAGGTAADRKAADATLTEAVKARGHPVWSAIMWGAIRFGGHPYWPPVWPFTLWRWGYGWSWWRFRAYAPLDAKAVAERDHQLEMVSHAAK